MSSLYEEIYQQSIQSPETFWAEAAEDVHWFRKWDRVLDDTNPPFYRWFRGGLTNSCYNALDIHVERGLGERIALIYDSPLTDTVRKFTYGELRDEVARFAGGLESLGVRKGGRVVIYMPMVPEAVVAMLACARLGAVHSVVFGGFAAPELAKRIADAKPKVIVSASCGLEPGRTIAYKPMLDEAIELSPWKPDRCVILQRPQVTAALDTQRDLDWSALVMTSAPVDCVAVEATDPLYILYTSGTTGTPKGVVRDNGGHLVALKWSMEHIYGVKPGEVFWAASDIGWVVGHSYIVYAPLFHGCTTVLYEGKPVGTPDPGAFWRVIAQHDVKVLFTAPTAFRAIKRDDPNGEYMQRYDLSRFRYLFLAGERCDPDTWAWAQSRLGVPVIDHWWQTETGWPVGANCAGVQLFDTKPGSCTKPVPGFDVRVLDEAGVEIGRDQIGNVAIKLPLPPGCLPTLWQNDEEFQRTYLSTYPGYYRTADAGIIDADGYLWIMSRTDDIINVAGHRLSTGGIEEVLASHPDVAECAVVGVSDELKGEIPLGFVVLKAGVTRAHPVICGELVQLVRERIGAVASFKQAMVVKRLPKTRSGKVVRGTMKKIADGKPYNVPATIEDAGALDEITSGLKTIGYASVPPPSDSTNDVINVAGYPLHARDVERVCLTVDGVREAAAVPVPDDARGRVPEVYLVIGDAAPTDLADAISRELVHGIGNVARPRAVRVVTALPKTAGGAVCRDVLTAISNRMPIRHSQVANPQVIEAIVRAVDAEVHPTGREVADDILKFGREPS